MSKGKLVILVGIIVIIVVSFFLLKGGQLSMQRNTAPVENPDVKSINDFDLSTSSKDEGKIDSKRNYRVNLYLTKGDQGSISEGILIVHGKNYSSNYLGLAPTEEMYKFATGKGASGFINELKREGDIYEVIQVDRIEGTTPIELEVEVDSLLTKFSFFGVVDGSDGNLALVSNQGAFDDSSQPRSPKIGSQSLMVGETVTFGNIPFQVVLTFGILE